MTHFAREIGKPPVTLPCQAFHAYFKKMDDVSTNNISTGLSSCVQFPQCHYLCTVTRTDALKHRIMNTAGICLAAAHQPCLPLTLTQGAFSCPSLHN